MKVFNQKQPMLPEMTTVAVEYQGAQLFFVPNWYLKDGENIKEILFEDLPIEVRDMHKMSLKMRVEEDVENIMKEIKAIVSEKINGIDWGYPMLKELESR